MKKEDLKTGMLALTGCGTIKMIINSVLVSNSSHQTINNNYNNDLTHDDFESLSINKVSKVLQGHLLRPENWTLETLNANLLWERQEVPKYVELLYSVAGFVKGDIAKVVRKEHDDYIVNVPNRTSISIFCPDVHYSNCDVKTSTREAYEAQFKVNEMTIEELEQLTGLTNLKIKK